MTQLTFGNSGSQKTSVKTPLFNCFEFHFLFLVIFKKCRVFFKDFFYGDDDLSFVNDLADVSKSRVPTEGEWKPKRVK